ncbi:MAG: Hpt domain-containing protein [Pseudomonadota bacterium]
MSESAALSLYVVSDELNETLRKAHVALEDALEERGAGESLLLCADHLHEIRGVLQMVEVYGAALLAEEMEASARHLARVRPDTKGRDEGLDALTRSMVQMPAYLERMLAGGRDIALVLLPLLNDLRAVRGKPLLSESTLLLLNADPDNDVDGARLAAPSGEDIHALAVKSRPAFQLALLGWIKGQNGNEDLAKLARVADSLEKAAPNSALHRLWWVVGGVLEALRDSGLQTSVSIKRLLGQADREIKRLIDQGLELYTAEPPTDLLNNLLYYVARASSSGERVSAVRNAFNLAELIPGDQQVEEVRQGLAAPGAKLMQTVASVIKEDLARVKDVLDIYVRTGAENADDLGPQLEMLTKISDTLGVLGLGDLRGDIQKEVGRLGVIVNADVRVDDATLIQIAATLLRVEDSLDQQLTQLVKPEENGTADTNNLEGLDEKGTVDYQQVTHSVVRECLINLARLKEGIGRVAANNDDRVGIDNAASLLRGVTAGLLMLGKTRAMEVADRILSFVDVALRRSRDPLSTENMDRLADSVVSLEYYLETIQVGRRDPWYMLDNAESCLDYLEGQKIQPRGDGEAHAQTLQIAPDEVNQMFEGAASETPEKTEVLGAPEPSDVIALPVISDQSEHIDPELLELFIEESREEIESVQKFLPRWVEDETDNEALITVRRSFHTLKGSGRMVGAERIGEYCWSIEDLLNRLINRTLNRTPPMAQFIQEAADVLPDLVEQIEVGTEPRQDIAFIMTRAGAFADGDPNAATMRGAGEQHGSEDPALEMDPVLLDIFSKETDGHLSVIRKYLTNSEKLPPPYLVTEDLHRACHTLHGSANMANLERGIAVTGALNRMVRRYYDSDRSLDENGINLLVQSVDAVQTFVAQINTAEGDRRQFAALVESLNALTDSLTIAGVEPTDAELESVEDRISADQADVELSIVDSGVEPDDSANELDQEAPDAGFIDIPVQEIPDEDDDYDAEIAAIFTEEASELLEATEEALQDWGGDSAKSEPLRELKRHLHTLKGGARMAGIAAMGDLSHELETLLINLDDGRVDSNAGMQDLLQQSVDELHKMRDTVVAGHRVGRNENLLNQLRRYSGTTADEEPAVETTAPDEPGADDLEETGIVELLIPGAADAEEDADLEATPGESAELADPMSNTWIGRVDVANESLDSEIELESDSIDDKAFDESEQVFAPEEPAQDTQDVSPDSELHEPAAIIDLENDDDVFALEEIETADREIPESSEGSQLGAEEPEHDDEPAADPEDDKDPEAGGFDPEHTVVGVTNVFVDEAGESELESLMAAGMAGLTGTHRQIEARSQAPDEEDFDTPEEDLQVPLPAQRAVDGASSTGLAPGERQEFARIDAELLEDLLNAAGEISIFHSRLTQQVSLIDFNLAELDQTVSRLRGQLRKLEIETEAQILNRHQDEVRDGKFDPLELDRYSLIQQLSRALAESASDVGSIKDLLNSLTGDAETLLVQQARVTAELQDGLMRTRMVPFQRHVSRLTRLVRQAAQETGKQAELQVEGASGELDRQVLEKMLPPFEHMLRNAVIHGIEEPGRRREVNKPAGGRITVRLHREGSEMVIDVSDDGAGLNVEAIRAKAYESGLLSPDARVPDEQVMELILTPGFSTAGELTQSAGRGVGMDVVANEIKKLGGSLHITSIQGQGTNFTIRLPFTLAITQALVVRCGEETYALPLPSVEGVARVQRKQLDELLASKDRLLEYGERSYKIQHLGRALGGPESQLGDDDAPVPLILVRKGDVATALLTDEMLASREIVVKSVGPQLAGVQGIAGATILGDGSVVLILDTGALIQSSGSVVELREAPPAPVKVDERALVLVVDDSITVRRVTERFLKRQGMRAATAKDGIDAITRLEDERPDVILLDIEMPRMDGYEFASHVRKDERFKDIPIIMITSRVSEKHKARAIEIGVNDYLGKPYQDHQLLETIQRYLPTDDGDLL